MNELEMDNRKKDGKDKRDHIERKYNFYFHRNSVNYTSGP